MHWQLCRRHLDGVQNRTPLPALSGRSSSRKPQTMLVVVTSELLSPSWCSEHLGFCKNNNNNNKKKKQMNIVNDHCKLSLQIIQLYTGLLNSLWKRKLRDCLAQFESFSSQHQASHSTYRWPRLSAELVASLLSRWTERLLLLCMWARMLTGWRLPIKQAIDD